MLLCGCALPSLSRSETRGPGTCFPQGRPRHSRCFRGFRLQRERNFSEACVRAPPLLALALSPPVTRTSLPSIGPTPPLTGFVPKHREELDLQQQLVPRSSEDVGPGEALLAGPEGPRSRCCRDPSWWAPFTSSAGGGAEGWDVCSLCTPRAGLPKCSCSSHLPRREERGPPCRLCTHCV